MLRLTPKLPRRVNQEILNRLGKDGEPVVILKVCHVGDISPFDLLDENGTSFIFKWDQKHGAHVLRIPLSIWMDNNAALAHCLLDHRNPPFPLVPLFEVPAPVPAPAPFEFEATEDPPEQPPVDNAHVAPGCEKFDELAKIPTDEKTPPPDGAVVTPPLYEQISELAALGAIRLKDAAAKFEVGEATIKEALAHPDSLAQLGHAGWIKLKEPTA